MVMEETENEQVAKYYCGVVLFCFIVCRDGNEPSSLSRAFGSAYLRLDLAWLVYYKGQAQAF